MPVGEKFPVNFRSTSDPFVKKHAGEKMYQGLEALHISGSAQPSADGFRGLIKEIRRRTVRSTTADLKQENAWLCQWRGCEPVWQEELG